MPTCPCSMKNVVNEKLSNIKVNKLKFLLLEVSNASCQRYIYFSYNIPYDFSNTTMYHLVYDTFFCLIIFLSEELC